MGKRKGITFEAWLGVNKTQLLEIGGAADTGPGAFIVTESTRFIFRQGYDHTPGADGGDFNVDLTFGGKGFNYSNGLPAGGKIKSVLVEVEGNAAYSFMGLNLTVEDAAKYLKSDDPFAAFAQLLNGDDNIWGSPFNDTLDGRRGIDFIWGRDGNDILNGGKDDDLLDGGLGNDTLKDGDGDDVYQFSTTLGPDNFDVIKKFLNGDEIYLRGNVFTAFGLGKKVEAGEFVEGNVALDPNDFLLWDRGARTVFYDPDGNGLLAPVPIFKTGNDANLSHKSFEIGLQYDM